MEKKLSVEQIALIEETLVLKGLTYDDIKLEVTDHIASDIEHKMNLERTSFETVFTVVFNKWDGLLETTSSSIWLGLLFKAPKIVVDKLVSYSKKQVFIAVMLAFIFSIMLNTLNYYTHLQLYLSAIRTILTVLFFLMVLTTIVSLFLIWKSKFKTIYGRLFLFQGWVIFIFFYQFSISSEPLKRFDYSHSSGNNFISCFFFGFFFFYSFCHISTALRHFKTVTKLKLI
jgi:hypothetical protein